MTKSQGECLSREGNQTIDGAPILTNLHPTPVQQKTPRGTDRLGELWVRDGPPVQEQEKKSHPASELALGIKMAERSG